MRPIIAKTLPEFLDRFTNFKDAEFRSIEVSSATEITLVFAVQDNAREFDWITIAFEFSGVEDARLLEKNKLSFIDMREGISLLDFENKFAFAIGECYNSSSVVDSTCYVVSKSLKYKEGLF